MTPEVRQLIRDHIKSIYELEILLLVRSDVARGWDPAVVGGAVRGATDSAHACLRELVEKGLVVREATTDGEVFRYEPRSDELATTVDALVKEYEERPGAVVDVIYGAPIDKIRSFADAFRIRREHEDG